MNSHNLLNQSTSLSPEDQFLLELLVDGELDDPNRRDLLLRLDRLQDGWRCCAIAFLEAQCLKESLGDSSFQTVLGRVPQARTLGAKRTAGTQRATGTQQATGVKESQAVSSGDRLEQTVYVSVRDIPDPSPNGNDSDLIQEERNPNGAERNASKIETGSDSVSTDPLADKTSMNSADAVSDYSHPTEGNAALDSVFHSSSVHADKNGEASDNPFIIPIRKGGFTRVHFGRGLDKQLNKAGLSWRSFMTSAACGFLLAAAMGVLFGEWLWRNHPSDLNPPQSRFVAEYSVPETISQDALPSFSNPLPIDGGRESGPRIVRSGYPAEGAAPADANRPDGFYVADSIAANGSDSADSTTKNAASDGAPYPIRQVTLKRSQSDKGISVPCIETNSYDPTLLRQSSSDAYVKNLQKDGCKVETVYEEFRFPLKDGKTLIVPVDTINVHRPAKVNFQ